MNDLINEILEKVKENRNIYEKGEYAVRDHLINPILNQLGWITSNPKFVIPNLKSEDKDIPDYTLFKNGEKVLFVEAKNISIDLEDEIPQLAKYCYAQGTEFGILTNGINWILFRTFLRGTMLKERIIWGINLENGHREMIINKLKTLDYNTIENLEKIVKNDKILENAWQDFLNNPDVLLLKVAQIFKEHICKNFAEAEVQEDEIISYFKTKFSDLIISKTQYSENECLNNKDEESILKNKATTPPVADWVKGIPELSKKSNLKSWKAICDHLKIDVGGDSARRALKRWVEENKPNWPGIPEPEKGRMN
jgi:predicted type IV restriction endonuclease